MRPYSWIVSLTCGVCVLVFGDALAGPPSESVPRVGMYALKGQILPTGTCTKEQLLPPFKYLYFVGRTEGSKFYYLRSPGVEAAAVALPPFPKPSHPWHGQMTWSINPLTFQPPSVLTRFAVSVTQVDENVIFLDGKLDVPTSSGGTCTEPVEYTGVLVSGID